MNQLVNVAGLLAILSCLIPVWRARKRLRDTTLLAAWVWLTMALSGWSVIAAADCMGLLEPIGLRQMAWYAIAILMLCPAIFVLGARRPLTRVWSWFVVLPFCLVFSWPAAASLQQLLRGGEFHLEAPMAVGFAFVVVMSIGNYLGTRYTMPTALTLGALLLLIAAAAGAELSWLPTPGHSRSAATFMVFTAIWWATSLSSDKYPVRTPLDRVWIEFRDTFGVVWSKRILDRLNGMAANDHLDVRMDISGVVPVDPSDLTEDYQPEPLALAALEKHLRWLLRRFVEESWIDERLWNDGPSEDRPNEFGQTESQ